MKKKKKKKILNYGYVHVITKYHLAFSHCVLSTVFQSMYDFEFNITVDDQFFDRINYTLNMTDYFGGGKRFTITNEKHSHYVKKLELRVR